MSETNQELVSSILAIVTKLIGGEPDISVLKVMIENCIEEFKAITKRDVIITSYEPTIARMVVECWNKRNSEGLNSESYSGVSYNYESNYSAALVSAIKHFRKVVCA